MDRRGITFFKKVWSVFATNGALFVIGLGSSILSARLLGPDGKGIVGSAVALSGIGAQFMNLGMHGAGNYYLAKHPQRLNRVMGNALMLAAAAAVAAVLFYCAFQIMPEWTTLQGLMLVLACTYIPLNLYQMLQQNLFLGIGDVRNYNRVNLANGILYPVLLLALLLMGSNAPELVFSCTIVTSILTCVIGYVLIRKHLPDAIRPDKQLFRECLPFGLKSYAACLGSYLVIRLDVLMVGHFLGNEQTGYYTVAVALSDVVSMVPNAVSTLLFPEAAAMRSNWERSQFMKQTLKILAIFMAVLTMAACLLSGFFIPLLYGEVYAPSAQIFNLLMPAVFFMALQSALSNYFAAKNQWTGNILTPFTGLAINIMLNAILIPRNGIAGAAIASIVAYGVMLLIMLGRFVRDNQKMKKEQCPE